jgi:hypothetical protein
MLIQVQLYKFKAANSNVVSGTVAASLELSDQG